MKNFSLIFGLMVLFTVHHDVYAQPTPNFESLNPRFGSGIDGDINFTYFQELDLIRAKVTAIKQLSSKSGPWPYVYEISHNNAHGNWIQVDLNDIVILYQAYQPNCDVNGYLDKPAHIFAWVSSAPNVSPITIRTNVPLSQTLIPTSITSNDQVQIQRISQWDNVTLNSNSGPTCAAWDGETGGILVVMAKTLLTFNGNDMLMNVAEKGFRGGSRDNQISQNRATYNASHGTVLNVDASGGGGVANLGDRPSIYLSCPKIGLHKTLINARET